RAPRFARPRNDDPSSPRSIRRVALGLISTWRQGKHRFLPLDRINEHEFAVICCTQLLIRIQKLDAVHRAVRCDINIELVAYANRFHLAALRSQAKVSDVVVPVVGQFHDASPSKVLRYATPSSSQGELITHPPSAPR